ncbi:Tim44/TimA family putative adaptor protein [Paracoccus sp. SCSIO 75233]|uniref:Tim44/TimA family putative adaptor protein n=1 Tax=Paracoccus sp. SCSIO 75233 TaxID=3017782 RepID=UPI0022F078DB|nr:Tim44/TimA family putative adaptor protein [Paracoccus sp. SCSIO 75233]WBU52889.1 Tim44/TimA family putative adaptor protein [Paracoccus sp. SCSIO 75233]
MSNPMIQLIVLAAIAVFLIIRLRGVLGTRDGFEPTRVEQRQAERDFEVIDGDKAAPQDEDLTDHVDPESPAYAALLAMKQVEPDFSLGEFLSGAKQAYEMILVAFEKGDLGEVRPFLAEEVAGAFQGAIDARDRAGQTVDVQFLGTRETALAAAEFDTSTNQAALSVRFLGEMLVATRDAEGKVVDGDASTPRKQRDTWTFERVMGEADPNWQLVATGV